MLTAKIDRAPAPHPSPLPSAPGAPTTKRAQITRSRSGCLTCRHRKVKCDETPGECRNCVRIAARCVWPVKKGPKEGGGADRSARDERETAHSGPVLETGGVSSRTSACEACRRSKTRCDRERPTCGRCAKSQAECVYESRSSVNQSPPWKRKRIDSEDEVDGRVGGEPSGPVRSPRTLPRTLGPMSTFDPAPRPGDMITRHELDRLLDAYFNHVHNTGMNAFIHRGELMRDIHEQGPEASLVVKAICASAYRYLDYSERTHPDGGERPAMWARETIQGIMADPDELSEERLAASLIIQNHESVSGRYVSAWLFVALAVRMAIAMRLNLEPAPNEKPADHPRHDTMMTSEVIARETRRRLMWAAFSIDCTACAGLPELTMCVMSTIRTALPCAERFYVLGIPARSRSVDELADEDTQHEPLEPGEDGLAARFVRLMVIRGDLLRCVLFHGLATLNTRYVKHLQDYPVKPWQPNSLFQRYIAQLNHWQQTLSSDLCLSMTNLFVRHGANELQAFLVIHLVCDQLYSDLYRFAMPGFAESAPADYLADAPPGWIEKTRYACYERSRAAGQKFELLETHFPDVVLTMNSHYIVSAYESIRNQVQYLLIRTSVGLEESQTMQAEYPIAALRDTQGQFESIINVVGKTTKYFYKNWKFVRPLRSDHSLTGSCTRSPSC